MTASSAPATYDFFLNGGEMGALMRAKDWRATPLGNPDAWPEILKTTLRLMLSSNQPIFVMWDTDLVQFYNDAYRQTMGPERHPSALGQDARACWGEIWHIIGPEIESIMADGPATWHEDKLVPVTRHGKLEDVWWTYGCSPIKDVGTVRGVLVICTNVTSEHLLREELKMVNAQLIEQLRHRDEMDKRQAFRIELADRLRGLVESEAVAAVAFELLVSYLSASRVFYVEIDTEARQFVVPYEWRHDNALPIVGRSSAVTACGANHVQTLADGQILCISDIHTDPRTALDINAYVALGVRALLVIPIIKQARLVAALGFHHTCTFFWPAREFDLMEEVAERVWNAVERAKADEQRRRAEHSLMLQREAETHRLRTLFSQAPGFMCILREPTHIFEFANDAYCRLVGARELVGKSAAQAMPETVEQGFIVLLDQVFGSGQPYTASEMPLTLQGPGDVAARNLYVDFVFQPNVNEMGKVIGIFVEGFDATERVLTRKALEQSELRLKEGMTAARMIVWEWTISDKQIRFSDNVCTVLGGRWDHVDDAFSVVHPDDIERLHIALAGAIKTCSDYEEIVRIIRPDNGHIVWLQVHGKVICNDNCQPLLVRGAALDITARKLAEEALRDADRRKDEFLAMLAHELRNPLAPISAAAQLLNLISNNPARVKQTSEIIARQVGHMSSLLSDLLDVSRVTTGLIELDKHVLDICQIAHESIEQVHAFIEQRRHKFTFTTGPASSLVCGDRMRLVQVITNLLQNAGKYTNEGGHIALTIEESDTEVMLSVRDNGVGIGAQLLPHVFELFAQERRSADRSQGGLGLGLALVHSLVQLHGGRVTASSAGRGQGSTFSVFLPRYEGNRSAASVQHGVIAPITTYALHILVVDDNTDAANVLAQYLQAAGHTVVVEHDSEAALRHAASGAHDVFLLDIGLPGLDGNQLARQIKTMPEAAGLTLIALTGYGQEHDRERSLSAGFDHFFVKPVETDKLVAVLAGVHGRAQNPG